MTTTARKVIWPTDTKIVVRIVMLAVGQGDCAIILVRSGEGYQVLVADINQHPNVGIDVPKLVRDLVGNVGIDVFINTHPHNDHLCGITDLADVVNIREVWHSGHVPGKKDRDAYDNLQKVIKKVKKDYGTQAEVELTGSRSPTKIGEAEYYVLSPAQHIVDEIADETDDARRKRIHEQCVVIKFGISDTWIMLTGDADRDAWELNITEYHKDRINANILSASHHGARSFFKHDKEDEPYLDALQGIAPTHVVVSAPTVKESHHDHPHPDAISLYEDEVGAKEVYHTGKNRHSFICDIFDDKSCTLKSDDGALIKAYLLTDDNDGGGEKSRAVDATYTRPDVREARPFA